MTTTAEPPPSAAEATAANEAPTRGPLARAEGVELLGAVHGCGYRDGAALVRRGDGQMVQLGPLMYALLECVDGDRDVAELAEALSEQLGRRVEPEHVVRLAQKLADQGLLAGTEHQAPPRRNPLLALRWKVLVTDRTLTRRLTAPFAVLFSPWVMWPVLAAFAVVFWFVLIHKGVASATAQAFHSPLLFLLVFVLAVVSAGFHELGHAAACRYGGAEPGGMGMGLYLVWPAFYTDVTDTYRLPKRARLRVDLAGLYFNTVVAVLTMAAWLIWRADALLLLVALQILQMVKQLSPVIRADGYHILSDATGVPDLYAQMGPTMRRLLPRHRHEPSTLTGRARLLVTVWVLIIVPVLVSLSLSAVILLPRLATSAWDSGRHIVLAIPHQAGHGQIIDVLVSVIRLLALVLPVAGSGLVTQRILRTTVTRALAWSGGRPARHAVLAVAAAAIAAGAAWAWWPAGQYQPVRATQGGTLSGMVRLVSSPATIARPTAQPVGAGRAVSLAPGRHLAVAMIPVGGATRAHPALFVVPGSRGRPPVAILSPSASNPVRQGAGGVAAAPTTSGATTPATPGPATSTTATSSTGAPSTSTSTSGSAFPFTLPSAPGPNGSQAVAVGTQAGGVTYDVVYSLVTVSHGAPVTETNSAYALADCNACTTVAVSFQVVLVVGETKDIAPINAAGALNDNCPACMTTAIADQMVITLKRQPSGRLLAELDAALKTLNALPSLGAAGTPAAVAAQVAAVQQQVQTALDNSGDEANPPTSSSAGSGSGSASTATTATTGSSPPGTGSSGTSGASGTGPSTATSAPPGSSSASTTATTPATDTTTTAPAQSSGTATTATSTTSSAPTTSTTATTTTASSG